MALNRLYQTFVQVVESATLVQAAAELHLTQPTVSRQVQQLELELGQALFDRIGGRLVLTPAGATVYETAKRLFTLEEKMREDVASLANPEIGRVTLGAGVTPAIYLLPAVFAAYRHAHAGVTFHLRTGSSVEIVTALWQREIDVGIVTTVPEDVSDLLTVPLYRDDLLLVAPPQHPLALRPAITVQNLAEFPFILMPIGSGLRRLTETLTGNRGIQVTAAMEADSLESINRLVQAGLGISFLPRSCVQDDLVAGRLMVLHLMDVPPPWRTITLVRRAEGRLSGAAARFVDELPTWFRQIYGHRERADKL